MLERERERDRDREIERERWRGGRVGEIYEEREVEGVRERGRELERKWQKARTISVSNSICCEGVFSWSITRSSSFGCDSGIKVDESASSCGG
jgi:hypothetical protein